jgi:CMP-N-acetylneuraminic acid synthetase
MTSYAFIFARGGSKGLPGKNIKPLLGKPLIQYSIEVALQISDGAKVFVSTDDADIAKVSSSSGAIVIERPFELSQDDSPEWLAWKHAISWVRERYGDFEEFISLPATSPLRRVKDVESAILKRSNIGADSCIAITPAMRSPYFNMVKELDNNLIELVNKPTNSVFRRQDAPEVFDITTVVYVANVEFIMNNASLFDGTVTSVEVPRHRAVDIDDIDDFNFAESILNNTFNEGDQC